MATEGRAGVMIDVILDERDAITRFQRGTAMTSAIRRPAIS